MSRHASSRHTSKQQEGANQLKLNSLTAPKYLEPLNEIISQRLVSSLREPAAFTVSEGFVVSSLSEAASALERFVSFENKLSKDSELATAVATLRRFTGDTLTIDFPPAVLSSRPLLNYYRSCEITRCGSSQLALRFGDGVIPHEIHAHMKLPALVVAEQRNFHLEPIPGTRGAKAFSTMAATSLLADRLHSHPQFTVHTSSPHLTFSFNKEEFDVSLNLLCYRNGSDHYSHDLVIFPCGGIDIPWQLRERLTVSIAPAIAPPYRDVDDMVSRASQLSAVASIVTAGLEELFGLRSKTRLKSVAPISAQEVEALLKYHARTTP